MSRGSDAAVSVTTSYAEVFNADTDGDASAAGIEAAGSDRVAVKWTTKGGKVNYLTVAAGDYKAFSAKKSGIQKIEVKAANATTCYFDLLRSDDF